MTKTIVGEINQWSDLRPGKFGSFNRGLQIANVWYNYYSKDANYINNLVNDFKAGTVVKLEYDDTKGYKPVTKMEKTEEEATQTQITNTIKSEPVPVVDNEKEHILRCASLDAAMELTTGLMLSGRETIENPLDYTLGTADKLLKWLRK